MLELTEDCRPLAHEIAAITRTAFARQYGTGDDEVSIIERLRGDGDVVVEIAALEDGAVVGHAMFSRMSVAPATIKVAALGPVCARIDRQRSGIGAALIARGHDIGRTKGLDAVALLGDPEYYRRFGYSAETASPLVCKFSGPHFQALELRPGALAGGRWDVAYPKAFG